MEISTERVIKYNGIYGEVILRYPVGDLDATCRLVRELCEDGKIHEMDIAPLHRITWNLEWPIEKRRRERAERELVKRQQSERKVCEIMRETAAI